MSLHPFIVQLRPLGGGAYTRLRLRAFVPTPMPARALGRLCALLSLFSGAPPVFVLSAGKEAAPWCEWWVESIAGMPGHQLRVRFAPRRGQVRRGR